MSDKTEQSGNSGGLKPCPICGGKAANIYTGYGTEMRWGCVGCGVYALSRDQWQALPRQSDTVREVVELAKQRANEWSGCAGIEFGEIATRLSAAVEPERDRVPGEVWVIEQHGKLARVFAREPTRAEAPEHLVNVTRVPVHGTPTGDVESDHCPPGFPLQCSFCGGSESFIVVGPMVCICVDCAAMATNGKDCGIPDPDCEALNLKAGRYEGRLKMANRTTRRALDRIANLQFKLNAANARIEELTRIANTAQAEAGLLRDKLTAASARIEEMEGESFGICIAERKGLEKERDSARAEVEEHKAGMDMLLDSNRELRAEATRLKNDLGTMIYVCEHEPAYTGKVIESIRGRVVLKISKPGAANDPTEAVEEPLDSLWELTKK